MRKLFYFGVLVFCVSIALNLFVVLRAGDRIFQPHEVLMYIAPIMVGTGISFWSGARLLLDK